MFTYVFYGKLFGNFSDKELKRIKPIANKVLELEPEMQKLTDEELQAKTPYLKEKLKNGASLDDILPEAFAVCREADWRVLGLKPYRCRSSAALCFIVPALPRCRPVKARPWWPPCPFT